MSVSLYDLLDIDRDATPAEIRTAWKAAIADLDPTDRRFRAYNDAAAVLLDERKRAAYDAELDGHDDDGPSDTANLAPESTASLAASDRVAEGPADEDSADEDRADEEGTGEEGTGEEGEPKEAAAAPGGPPTWALAAVTALAAFSLATLIVVLSWPGSRPDWLGGDRSPADRAEQAAEVEDAGASAENFAADAVPAVLSYDYRTLDEDFAEAATYLTDDFAAQRSELFDEEAESGLTLREQVVADKVVVAAAVSGTGLTRVGEDGERATVVVFVDQDSQRGNDAPRSLRMWATLSLVKEDGGWLLDDICTESDCS